MQRLYSFIKRKLNYIFNYDVIEFLISIQTYTILRKVKYKKNSILVIEPNNFHGEILPGYVYYFNQLGYHSTLLVRRENYNQGLFSLFDEDELPALYCINNLFLKLFFSKQPNFDFVFFTSSMVCEKFGYYGYIFDYFKNNISGKYGYFFTEHSFPNLIPHLNTNKVNPNQIALLSPLHNNNTYKNIAVINPNYFGKISVDPKRKQKKTFITVGAINPRNRNIDLLFEMVKSMDPEFDDSYEILIVGRGVKKQMFPHLPKQIKILGELTFKDLFYELERSDYLLPLLDPDFDGHRRYLNGETTGSKQLILGFSIVPVIHAKFAEVYGFSDNNSILYSNNFNAAMSEAIMLDAKTFSDKREQINKLAKEIRSHSLDNLKTMLEKQRK